MRLARDPTILALLLALPLLLLLGLVMPHWLRFLLQVSFAGALAVLAVSLQMRAGLVSFGQGLYYCLGAYAAGMAGQFLGITDAFLLLALAILLAGAVGLVLGFLMARYRGIFFAMLSLAFSMVLYGVLVKAEALGSTDGFNLPDTTFAGVALEGEPLRFAIYSLNCAATLLVAILVHVYQSSPMGAVGDAIRENEIRVEYLGVSPRLVLHAKYVLAAVVSGIGGALAALAVGHVEPEMAYWTTSGQFVFVALLSGPGSVIAPLIGTFLLEVIRVYAQQYSPYTWQAILGAVMLAVILFLPGGLWSLVALRRGRG